MIVIERVDGDPNLLRVTITGHNGISVSEELPKEEADAVARRLIAMADLRSSGQKIYS
jgi:hypothetical protein